MGRLIAVVVWVLALVAGNALAADASGAASAAGARPGAADRARVVIQVSDAEPAKWQLTLNNIGNVQKDLGADKVDIEVVAYGPGLGMLRDDSVAANRVQDALKTGVRFIACRNTMQNQHLTEGDMLAGIGYVQAGVVEIIDKQRQGWAYLRP